MPNIGPTNLLIALVAGHGSRESKDSVTGRDRLGPDDVALAAAPIADDVPAQAPTRR